MSKDREILDFLRADFARLNERLDPRRHSPRRMTTRISALERDGASLSLRIVEGRFRRDAEPI